MSEEARPGLFFYIVNECDAAVKGFAVGDEICRLKVGSGTYTRLIFHGDLAPGEESFAMACAGKDGKGRVIFVPPAGVSLPAVAVTVGSEERVPIPTSFCALEPGPANVPEGLLDSPSS